MANDQDFALPGSGYDLVKKILHAYVLCGDKEVALGEVSQKAGMIHTMVSRNNRFLAGAGIIEGGRKKKLTAKGRKLALAVSHDDQEATAAAWRDIIAESTHLSGVVDMIKVQGGVIQANLSARIASQFGFPGGKGTTGLNALVEMLADAGVITLEGNKYVVAKVPRGPGTGPAAKNDDSKGTTDLDEGGARAVETAGEQTIRTHQGRNGWETPMVPIHINIELHLPASAEQGVYDAIFKSIRQNLMEPVDGLSDAS
jgi:hypothetical protein